jgi:hypothetical protein
MQLPLTKTARGFVLVGIGSVFAFLAFLCDGDWPCQAATCGIVVIVWICGVANELTDDRHRPAPERRRLVARLEAAGHPIIELARALEKPLWRHTADLEKWRPGDGFDSRESRWAMWDLAGGELPSFIEKAPDEQALAMAKAVRNYLREQRDHDPLAARSWFYSKFDEEEACIQAVGEEADEAFKDAAVATILEAVRNPRAETPEADKAQAEEMAQRAVRQGVLLANSLDWALLRKYAEDDEAGAFVDAMHSFLDYLLSRPEPDAAGAVRHLLSLQTA